MTANETPAWRGLEKSAGRLASYRHSTAVWARFRAAQVRLAESRKRDRDSGGER
jgi:hypothetical protein